MARKKPKPKATPILFNVVYEDGTLSSNRKVPSTELGGFEGDEPARAFIEEQDRRIAQQSGQPPRQIKSITRA